MTDNDIEIITEPGLADAVRSGTEPYRGADIDFLDSVGADSPVGHDFRKTREDARAEAAEALSWHDIVAFFAPEYHRPIGEQEHNVELSAYWLDVPSGTGASATLAVSREAALDSVTSFTIAGTGGGPRFIVKQKAGISDYTTPKPRRVTLDVTGQFQLIEVTKQRKVIGQYARLVTLDMPQREWHFTELTSPLPDQLGAVVDSEAYDLTAETSPLKVTFTVNRGTEVKSTLGLKLDKLGIDASTSVTVGYMSEASLVYTVPAGTSARWTLYSGLPFYLWKSDPASGSSLDSSEAGVNH